jgi:hypothetical protein
MASNTTSNGNAIAILKVKYSVITIKEKLNKSVVTKKR